MFAYALDARQRLLVIAHSCSISLACLQVLHAANPLGLLGQAAALSNRFRDTHIPESSTGTGTRYLNACAVLILIVDMSMARSVDQAWSG